MGSQDQNRYKDPDISVEQYSLEYMRSLKSSAPETMLDLWRAGHFADAIEEHAENKAANKTYTRNKGVSQAGSMKGLTEKLEADQQASKAILADRKKEALETLRRLGVNPEDLR